MKAVFFLFLFISIGTTGQATETFDFNFDEARHCQGSFDYEKTFLLDGRSSSEHLVRDPVATHLVSTLRFGEILQPVSDAYSMKMSKNYIRYESLKDIVDELAVVLVKSQAAGGTSPGDQNGYDYDLLLVVTKGKIKGVVLASHPASVDLATGTLQSPRFLCSQSK